MVAIVSGNGLGVQNSSASILGLNGIFGNGAQGSNREAAYINLFNGNVTLQEKDEFLAARSIDAGLTRSYNSQGAASGGFGWRHGPARRLGFDGAPNAAGSKVTLTDADGSASLYLFDGQRYVSTDGGGAFRTIVYDAGSQQWTWQDNHNDRSGLYEIYNSKGLLQSTWDLGGMVRSYEYTTILGQDLISTVKNPASGDVTSYAYDARGKLTQISTMAGGKTVSRTTYGFTADRLTSVSVDLTPENSSDAVVYTTTYGYDAANRVNRITQSDGSVLGFDYDATGRVTAFYDDAGRKTVITYAAGRATVTDPLGYKTTYVSGANGLLSEVIVNDGLSANLVQRSKYFYDASGNLERMSDIRGIETKYTYDKNGNWLTRRDSAGLLVTRRYTANNLLAAETSYQVADTDGDNASTAPMTTRYVYNSQNQLRFVLSAEGKVTEYRYDALGQRSAQWQYNDRSYSASADPAMIVSEEALSNWAAGADRSQAQLQEYAYDARGTLTTSTSYTEVGADGKGGAAVVQSYVRDHGGQILASYAGTRKTADYAYDGLGRVISQSKDDGNTIYSYNGNATTVSVTPTGANRPVRSTTSTYDTAGRLLSATETTADAGDSKITNVYDKDGRLHSSTDANGLTSYNFYDQAGRLIFTIDPSRTGTRYIYNTLGQLVQTTVYAVLIPAINMMSSPGVPVISSSFGNANAYDRHSYISYDSAGRILDTVDAEGYVTRRFYDGASRLIRSTAYIAPLTPAQLKTYATTPVAPTASLVGADRDTYNIYDNDDRLIGTVDADAYLTELRYDTEGNVVKKIRYANQVKNPAANTLTGLQINANPAEDRVTDFQYGAGKRLLRQSESDGSYQKFSYDGAGNITGIERGADRMTMVRYDAQGRVISELNAEGALRLRQLPPGASLESVWQQYAVNYTYNSAGQRTSVRDALGNRTLFHYDGHGKLRFTVNALGEVSENRYDSNGVLTKTVQYAKRIGIADLAKLSGGDAQELQTLVPALRDDTQDQANTFYYDDAGRLLFTVNAGGRVQGLQYNVFGQVAVKVSYNTVLADKTVKGLVGGRGKTALAELAGFPNKDVKNAREAVVYDIKGRLRFSINPAGLQLGITGYTYNEFGELKDKTLYNRAHDPNSFEGGVDEIVRVSSQPAFVQSVESYLYNKRGLRIDTADALKNHTLTSYNAFGEVSMASKLVSANSTARSSLDISLRTIYDRGGRVLATIDGRGALVYNRYDDSDNLVERIAYANLLTPAKAERASAADIADIAAALTDLEHDLRQRFVYDADNRLTSTLTSQRYDAAAKATAWSVSSQEYDKHGNVVMRKTYAQSLWLNDAADFTTGVPAADEADSITRTSYDALNRAVATATLQRVEGGVKVWSLAAQRYDSFGNIISKIQYATPLRGSDLPADLRTAAAASAADRRTLFAYDAQNRVRLSVDAEGSATQFGYDSRGNVLTETRFKDKVSLGDSIPAGFTPPASDQDRVVTNEYDLVNRLIKTNNGLSQTDKRYDMSGNLQSVSYYGDPVRTESYLYDLNGRLRFSFGNNVKETRYNALGQAVKTVLYMDGSGLPWMSNLPKTAAEMEALVTKANASYPEELYQRVQSFEYDAQGNLVKSTDAMQNSESYAYDALGRKTSFTNKLGQTWTYNYDTAGHLVSELSPEVKVYSQALATSMGNWGAGAAARMLTKMEYDALGNLIRREEGAAGELGRVTEYRYDRVGRQIETILPAAEVDAGGIPGSRNDSLRRGSIKVRYDAFGNAVSNEDVGGKLSYKIYDKLGRVRFAQDALGYVTEYDLNSYGEVTTLTRYNQPQRSAAGQTEADFERDLILDTAQDRSIKSSYDKAGRLQKTVEPLAWSYDQQSTTSPMYVEAARTTEFQYNSFGELKSEIIYGAAADGTRVGNPKETFYAYDTRGFKIAQLNSGGLTRFGYDAAGNLIRKKEFSAGYSSEWSNPWSEPTSSSETDRILNYTYDKNNNRLTETQEMVRFVDATTGNKKESLTTTTTYDALGRAIKVEDALKNATFTYYDALGRVTAIAKQLNERESKLTEFKLDIYGNAVLHIEYAKAALDASTQAPPTVVDAASADNRVTATRFDLNGHAMEVLDAVRYAKGESSKAIHYAYDIFGRVAKQWRSVTNAGREEIAYQINGYDKLGRLASVRTPGNIDLVDGTAAVEIDKTTNYNGFGEVTSTRLKDALGDREISYTRYDRAGRAWLSNADDGIHKVSLYDAFGQRTALIRSNSNDADEFLGLTDAKQVLQFGNVQRSEKQYNALGYVIDSREIAETRFIMRRVGERWVRIAANEGSSADDLIVLGNKVPEGATTKLRLYLPAKAAWVDVTADRLNVLDGYPVFNAGGLEPGQYGYELSYEFAPGFGSASILSGTVKVAVTQSVPQHAQLLGLYLMMLNRPAEPDGINFWTDRYNKGLTLSQLALGIFQSQEATTTLPTGNRELVTQLMSNMLKRSPSDDPTLLRELARWTAALERANKQPQEIGVVLAEMSEYYRPQMQKRIDVLISYVITGGGNERETASRLMQLADSQPDQVDAAISQALATERQRNQLVHLYIGLLGRVPDKASFDSRYAMLQGGASLEALAVDILKTPEALGLLQAEGPLSNPDAYNRRLIKLVYQNLAGRLPSAVEETWELGRLTATYPDLSHGSLVTALATRVASSTPDGNLAAARATLFRKLQAGLVFAKITLPPADPALLLAYYRGVMVGASNTIPWVLESQSKSVHDLANASKTVDTYYSVDAKRSRLAMLYPVLLNRAPDQIGLEAWMNSLQLGTSWERIADAMLQIEGGESSLYPASLSNNEFVTRFYKIAFGRDAAPAAVAPWAAQLPGKSRGELALAMVDAILFSTLPEDAEARTLLFDKASVGLLYGLNLGGNDREHARQINQMVASGDKAGAIRYANAIRAEEIHTTAGRMVDALNSAASHIANTLGLLPQVLQANDAVASALAASQANAMAQPLLRASALYAGLLNRANNGTEGLDFGGIVGTTLEMSKGATDLAFAQRMLDSPEGRKLFPRDDYKPAAYVRQLFRQMQNREPTAESLAYWSAAAPTLESRAQVAVKLLNSFLYDPVDDANSDKLAILQSRIAFQQRVAGALSTLAAQTPHAVELARSVAQLAKEAELKQAVADSAKAAQLDAIKQAAATNERFMTEISRLYIGILNRGSDAGQLPLDPHGLNFWAGFRMNGLDVYGVAERMLASREGEQLFPPAQSNRDFLNQLSRQVLGRPMGETEQRWLTALEQEGRSRGWVAAEMIGTLTERTNATEADYLTKVRFEQRVLDNLLACQPGLTDEAALAGRDLAAKLAQKNTAQATSTVPQCQAELDAANRMSLADFPDLEKAKTPIEPALRLLASKNLSKLSHLLVTFSQKLDYPAFAALLDKVDSGATTLLDVLTPLLPPLTDRSAFFRHLYQLVLHREPEAGALDFWLTNAVVAPLTKAEDVAWEFYKGAQRELTATDEVNVNRKEFTAEVTAAEAQIRAVAQEQTHSYDSALADANAQIAARRAQARQAYDTAYKTLKDAELAWELAAAYLPIAQAGPATAAAAIRVYQLSVAAGKAMAAALVPLERKAAIALELGIPVHATAAQFADIAAVAENMSSALPLLGSLLGARDSADRVDVNRTRIAQQINAEPVLTNQLTDLVRVFIVVTGKAPTLAELKLQLHMLEGGASMAQVADTFLLSKLGSIRYDDLVKTLYRNGRDVAVPGADSTVWRKALDTQSRGQVALDYARSLAIGAPVKETAAFLGKVQAAFSGLLPAMRQDIDNPDMAALLAANTTQARAVADWFAMPAYQGFNQQTISLLTAHQVYAVLLGREPTAEELFNDYNQRMQPNNAALVWVEKLLNTPEAKARIGSSNIPPEQYAAALARAGFGREADSTELAALVKSIGTNGKLLATYYFAVASFDIRPTELDKVVARAGQVARVSLSLTQSQAKLEQYSAWLKAMSLIGDVVTRTVGEERKVDLRTQGTLKVTTFDMQQRYQPNMTVDRWGNVLSISDPRNPNWKTTYTYNYNNQQLTQSSGGLGGLPVAITRAGYDQLGRLISSIDARGNGTGYAYDTNGNILGEYHADGGLVKSDYDLFGNRTYLRRYADTATSRYVQQNYAYDQLGHMVRSSSQEKLRVVWLSNDVKSWIKDGDRNQDVHEETRVLTESFEYDELGRKISSTDAAGVTSTTEYDLENNAVATMTAGLYRLVTRYDGMHNKRASLDANGMTMRWTVENYGAIKSYTDLGGNTTSYAYDGAGRKLSMQLKRTNGADGSTTYRYENGRLVEVYDDIAKMTTAYTYDVVGNRLSEKQSYAADAPRRPERLQNNVMTYDMYNRLRTVKDDLYTLTYAYDLNGNREGVRTQIAGTGQDFTVYNTYDKMNRQLLVNGIANTGDINKDLGKNGHLLAYDQLGNRIKDSYTGKRASDGSVGITTETFEYDSAGRLSAVNRDGHLIDRRDYDAVGRVSRSGMIDQPILKWRTAINNLGLDLQTRSYAYDIGGHVIRQNDRYWNRPDLDIFYVQDPGKPLGGYDAMGNLRGYVVVTEFPQEGDKGYYTINYDWLDGPKEVSTQLDQHGKLTMTSSTLDTYGRRISSVTPEGKVSQFFYDADGHVQAKTIDGKAAFNLIVNGQVLGEEDKSLDNVMGSTYETATATALTAPPAMYRVVGDNETLEGIAQALWGERNLWYLIGDANNLDRSAKLKAGDALRVPTRSNSVYNDSDSFKPYDASEQLGNTAPTMAPPKPPKKGGCGVIGQVIMVVVAVVVTWLTAGAAANLMGAAVSAMGVTGTAAAAMTVVGGAALSAAAGSIASQAVGMAIGAQDDFSWKAVGLSALSAGMTKGVGLAVGEGMLGGIFSDQGWQGAAARAVLTNTMSQGIANITGLQKGFNWRSVAASGVGAAAGSVAAGALQGDNLLAKITAGNELAQRSAVGFISGTATALARGGKIDVVTIATDAFGNALGRNLAESMQASSAQSAKLAWMDKRVDETKDDFLQNGERFADLNADSRSITRLRTAEMARINQEAKGENNQWGLTITEPVTRSEDGVMRVVFTMTPKMNESLLGQTIASEGSLAEAMDSWNIGTRAMGLVQLAGGLAGGFASGAAIAAGAVGAPLSGGASLFLSGAGYIGATASADQASAGLQTFLTGQSTRTLIGQGIEAVTGASPQISEFASGMFTLSPTAASTYAYTQTTRAMVSSYAISRATYSAPAIRPNAASPDITFRTNFVGPHPENTGPVWFKAPPNATAAQVGQVQTYIAGSNDALLADALSPTGRVSTTGKLTQQSSRTAALERQRAANAGTPYGAQQAGHVPDTTWNGTPTPYSWLPLDPVVNASLGGQARGYSIGYKPWVFLYGTP
ncbi:DUF6531 domain-containing protein [Massilia sp. erpn]|uniref:DUF6531 domain-containing protein n=1 Tax=Massilia sp. erpn TaxID=2738142 RepID=UPI0021055815|nr:DUF6531 domain-containing protein [Massilia sp. erpn]UTY59328.1 RHS repeat protein [Massilia sp. erpn]